MGFLTRIDNGLQAFKSAYSGTDDNKSLPDDFMGLNYARLEDGTHSYNYETERFGILGLFGLGSPFEKPIQNLKYYYKKTLFLQDCVNFYADFASGVTTFGWTEKLSPHALSLRHEKQKEELQFRI